MTARLKDREGLSALREACAKATAAEQRRILVCTGNGCIASGAADVVAKMQETLEEFGLSWSVGLMEDEHAIGLKQSGCHGLCEMSVLVRIEPEGWLYVRVKPEDCREIVEETIVSGRHIERLAHNRAA